MDICGGCRRRSSGDARIRSPSLARDAGLFCRTGNRAGSRHRYTTSCSRVTRWRASPCMPSIGRSQNLSKGTGRRRTLTADLVCDVLELTWPLALRVPAAAHRSRGQQLASTPVANYEVAIRKGALNGDAVPLRRETDVLER